MLPRENGTTQESLEKESMCSPQRKNLTAVPRHSGGRCFEELLYRGESSAETSSRLSYSLILVSCRSIGTNMDWPFYIVYTPTYTHCDPDTWTLGSSCCSAWMKKTSSWLPVWETWAHSWITGNHTVSHSADLWGRACRFNSSPHLKRRGSGHSLVLAVLFPLLNSCQHDCSSETLWVTSSC